MSGLEAVRVLFKVLGLWPIVSQSLGNYQNKQDIPSFERLRRSFEAKRLTYRWTLEDLFHGQSINRMQDNFQNGTTLQYPALAAGSEELLEYYAKVIFQLLTELAKEFHKMDKVQNGIGEGPIDKMGAFFTQQDRKRRYNLWRTLIKLTDEMKEFEDLVAKHCVKRSQQSSSNHPSGKHLQLDRLYQAISPKLRVCNSECSYHHVDLLLTELKPSHHSYIEKGADEDTSRLLVFIPTRNGQMTAFEWRSLEIKPISQPESVTEHPEETSAFLGSTTNGLIRTNAKLLTSQNGIVTNEIIINASKTTNGQLLNGHSSNCTEIDNICDSLSGTFSGNTDSFNLMGWIGGQSRDSFQLYNTGSRPNHSITSEHPSDDSKFKGLKATQRVELARVAALCFLNVISTPWAMSEPQDNEGIFLDPCLSATQPREMGIYVSHIFKANATTPQPQNNSRSNSLSQLTSPALYKLSLLLMELCLEETIDYPTNPVRSFKKAKYYLKKEFTCRILYKFGKPYKDAIQFCFDQSITNSCAQDLPKIFERNVYDSICEACRLVA